MKKAFAYLCFVFFALTACAQKDVTTFLGIPVDGYKHEMKQKLIAKGFTPNNIGDSEFLEGEFNGMDVHVYIATNNNKVYRIMICDAKNQNEANIKIRFNTLVRQFENNKRYTSLDKYTIPDEEDISYEMMVHKKNYDAVFYQIIDTTKFDTLEMQKKARNELLQKYTEEQIQNPTDEMIEDLHKIALRMYLENIAKKTVWFRICEYYGEYYITMFYDNEYNHANGEDL